MVDVKYWHVSWRIVGDGCIGPISMVRRLQDPSYREVWETNLSLSIGLGKAKQILLIVI